MYDLIIVGGGPAGLAAALAAGGHGLNYLVLERGVVANTVYQYPLARPLFSTPNEVELVKGGLPPGRKPLREEVLAHYVDLVAREPLNVQTGEEATSIKRTPAGLTIRTSSALHQARNVIVAVGGFGRVRRLNVPGESPHRVSYRFSEAHPFTGKSVLVVGGGNSAAEAAVYLADEGASVTLSIRRGELDVPATDGGRKIKPWVLEPLLRHADDGRIVVHTSSTVARIEPESAALAVRLDGEVVKQVEVPCDHIFALLGADPDTSLLETAGVEIAGDGRPVYDPATYETSVPGLYVAGHLTRQKHMKNAIPTGRAVVELIAARLGGRPARSPAEMQDLVS